MLRTRSLLVLLLLETLGGCQMPSDEAEVFYQRAAGTPADANVPLAGVWHGQVGNLGDPDARTALAGLVHLGDDRRGSRFNLVLKVDGMSTLVSEVIATRDAGGVWRFQKNIVDENPDGGHNDPIKTATEYTGILRPSGNPGEWELVIQELSSTHRHSEGAATSRRQYLFRRGGAGAGDDKVTR